MASRDELLVWMDKELGKFNGEDPSVAKMDSSVSNDIGNAIITALHTSIFNENLEAKIREEVMIAYKHGFTDGLGCER
jgi:hypothetical protein